MSTRILAVLSVLLTLSCGQQKEIQDVSVPVTIHVAQCRVITRTVVAYCRLESCNEALVTPLNPGRIVEVYVNEGDTVAAGEVLVELSTDQQYSGAVYAAAARLEAARAIAENSRNDLQRARRLRTDGAISENDYEMAVAAGASAEASVREALADYQSAQSISESGRILAPFSGTVGRVWAREGAISSGPLVSITDSGVITAELLVSDFHLLDLFTGMPAVFVTPHYSGEIFTGEVSSFSTSVDPVSGLVSVRIQLEDTTGRLRPGMTGAATLALETSRDAVVLPASILNRDDDDSWKAAVCRNGKAVLVPLEIGIVSGTNMEILSGVNAGDSVIAMGHHLVTDGATLRVVQQ